MKIRKGNSRWYAQYANREEFVHKKISFEVDVAVVNEFAKKLSTAHDIWTATIATPRDGTTVMFLPLPSPSTGPAEIDVRAAAHHEEQYDRCDNEYEDKSWVHMYSPSFPLVH